MLPGQHSPKTEPDTGGASLIAPCPNKYRRCVVFFLAPASVDPGLEQGCGSDPSWLCETVYDASNGNRLLVGIAGWLLAVVLILVGALFFSWLARRYLGRVVARMVAPDRSSAARQLERIGINTPAGLFSETDEIGDEDDVRKLARIRSISVVVESTATVIIWTVALLMVLGELGVNLAPLMAGAGIAGVALGFGAQSLVKDCLAGLFILLEDQYGIGDVVDLGEAVGTVEAITLRATTLRGLDGTVWHVPNGEAQRVGNKSQLWSVALVDVDVAYDCDLSLARQVIIDRAGDVCESDQWATSVLDPPQILGVEALGADGITIRVTVKTMPGSQWALQRSLREAFKDALDTAKIEIPFPQRTVWIRNDASGTEE
jgi:small-conductance mechanosensitive channel